MSKYILNGIQFDEDGAVTLTYLDKTEALRRRGAVLRTHAVTVAPDAGELYRDARSILEAAYELLKDIDEAYKDEPAWTPEDEPEEDDDEKGMGW